MSLITRQFGPNPKNAKLTIQDMDGNLLYLEQLAQQGGSGSLVNEEEISLELFDSFNAFEGEEVDFTLPITQNINTKFTGIKKEAIAETEIPVDGGGSIDIKIESLNLLGSIDATFLIDFFLSDAAGENSPPEEILETILSNKLSLDYTIQNVYIRVEEEFVLANKYISVIVKGQSILEASLQLELGSYYVYTSGDLSGGGGEHLFKLTEIGLDRRFLQHDFPNIIKGYISFEGVVEELPLLIRFDNLPSEELANIGFLYEDENGFVKVKRIV
jgi:hypothetical protein